jgi:hypothetical protein
MIQQPKSNPQLLDEQIFSERIASAISAIGPSVWTGRALQAECDDLELMGFQLPITLTTRADRLIGENLESKESLVIPC